MASGIKAINDRAKKQVEQRSWIRRLTLSDGEKAWFRYLATGDDSDHRYQDFSIHRTKTTDGKFGWEYCTSDEENGDICKNCLTSKQSYQFGVWVWVDYILRKRQNPALKDNDKATPWKAVKYNDERYYLQEVNAVRLWMSGPGQKRYILQQIIDAYDSYGTLMDRQYVMQREGAEKENTNYRIKPVNDKTNLTDKQLEAYRDLPPVREVVSGRQSYPPRDSVIATGPSDDEEVEEFTAPAASIMTEKVVSFESDDEPEELNFDNKIDPAVDDAIAKALARIDGDEDEPITRRKK